MAVYGDKQDLFNEIASIGSLIGGPLTTFISGVLIEYFEKRTEMTIPMLILLKALIEIPLNIASFSQNTMFYLSTGGVIGEYFFAKGWTAPAILVLKTVVDPSISGLGVAMFLLI